MIPLDQIFTRNRLIYSVTLRRRDESLALPILFVSALLAAACTNQVLLAYVPTTPIAMQALPAVGQITAVDQRGESDPTWIGAIRGGFEIPLKSSIRRNHWQKW